MRVADRFDPLSAPALRAFRMVAEAGARHGKPITLCGELASRPLEAVALAALGYRSLSVSPASIGPVKATLLELDVAAARKVLLPLLDDRTGTVDIRATLRAFALASGLAL
jgi:phosphotransferase system enzyme I (PtsP)